MVANLNHKKEGFRYSQNSKALVQVMKVYGGRKMCNLIAFNYCRPSYSTVKRDNKKSIQHVAGEHGDIFVVIVEIYKDAKATHGIVGPVPVILAEDKTKVKFCVAY